MTKLATLTDMYREVRKSLLDWTIHTFPTHTHTPEKGDRGRVGGYGEMKGVQIVKEGVI